MDKRGEAKTQLTQQFRTSYVPDPTHQSHFNTTDNATLYRHIVKCFTDIGRRRSSSQGGASSVNNNEGGDLASLCGDVVEEDDVWWFGFDDRQGNTGDPADALTPHIHLPGDDHSGRLQPPVDLVPTVLALSGR